MTDGAIDWTDLIDGTTWHWDSAQELARAYWTEHAMPTADEQDGPATGCVYDLTDLGDERTPLILEVLAELAPDDDARCHVGAGPLEDLLSHSGHGVAFVDEVETRARRSPAFRDALECVWLSTDVDPDVRRRLAVLGAGDLGTRTVSD